MFHITRNIEKYADTHHQCDEWWSSITHKRKSHTRKGYHIEIDSNIDKYLYEDKCRKSKCCILSEGIFDSSRYHITSVDDSQIDREEAKCSDKSELFHNHRKDKISLYFWKISKFLDRLSKAETPKSSTSYSRKSLFDLIILSIRFFFRKECFIILKETIYALWNIRELTSCSTLWCSELPKSVDTWGKYSSDNK